MMPAGTYYIGDLSYVITNDKWDEVCDLLYGEGEGEHVLKDGRRIAIYSTSYGDGEYDGIAVDSGSIGCILMSDINETPDGGYLEKTFTYDFETDTGGALIRFGNVEIYTGDTTDFSDDEDFGDSAW
jgi:hypothetical protein